ncbi:small ribosomal subunit protein bS18m [Parasteatoda tepidariorum]|uniref:small ribosomal subunit protein bS18m n=1 Tax=Parasteatoda tepidariorum TaxID=114398 RepID=UPI00077F966A|nr:28S ribosomal protein S18c, mitochondrial [Parasteatoda tepidariorum]
MNFLPKIMLPQLIFKKSKYLSTKIPSSLVSNIISTSSGITDQNVQDIVTKHTDSNAVTEHHDPDMFISDIKDPYELPKKVCIACKYKIPFDYKNPRLLSQFMSSYTGFIYDKHITGLCTAQQKRLVSAIKLSQTLGYMPILIKAPQYLRDPKLFDPFKPSRHNPH